MADLPTHPQSVAPADSQPPVRPPLQPPLRPFRIPFTLILVDLVGALITGFGVWGLIDSQAPERVPAFTAPVVAWLMLAIGVVMMIYAVFDLVRLARARRST